MNEADVCPGCGASVAKSQQFCRVCGRPLGARCATCGNTVAQGAKFCTNCGAAVTKKMPWLRLLLIVSLLFFAIGIGSVVYWQLDVIRESTAKGPVISNVIVRQTTLTTATIDWRTDVPASSQVEYGRSSNYGFLAPLEPKNDPTSGVSAGATEHSVLITDLTSGTTYRFRVRSKDADGNETTSTGNKTFKTKSPDEDRHYPLAWTGRDVFLSLSVELAELFNKAEVAGFQF